MQLTDEQKSKVAAWIADGVKLSDIQTRLASECDLRMTYMDVRLLVDDLKLMPKDPPAPVVPVSAEVPAETPAEPSPASGGGVTLTVDALARPGTMVSGSVTFSDGKNAAWYLDQTGRMGVVPEVEGYRPPEDDVEKFQASLDRELAKLGF